jgi:hypothetical protein
MTPIKQITIYVPRTCDEYKKCAENDFELDAIMSDHWLIATCSNQCKEAQRAFKIDSSYTFLKNFPSVGLMTVYVNKQIKVLGGAGYDRQLWKSVFIGGMGFSNGSDHAAIVRAGLLF